MEPRALPVGHITRHAARTRREPGPATAALRLRPAAAGLGLEPDRLEAVALLREPADRYRGRSAILDVAKTRVDGSTVRAVKLKGVGWTAADGTFRPPSAVSYFEGGPARWLHVDYDGEGRMLAEPAEDRPWGALLLDRARNEAAMLARVRAAGLPAPVPLGYGEFPDFSFVGRRTGFVVIGLADPDDRRAGQDVLVREAAAPREPAAEAGFVAWFAGLAQDVAALQRRVHAAGFTGGGPHLGNFSVTGAEVALHDLDALAEPAALGISGARLLGRRLRDYYVLAASVARRAYGPRWRAHRATLMRAVGEGYFGAAAAPELERLQPFDHLRFWEQLQRRGSIFLLPAPLLALMERAVSEDGVSSRTTESQCEPVPVPPGPTAHRALKRLVS